MSKLPVNFKEMTQQEIKEAGGQLSTQTLRTVHTYTAQSHENLLRDLSRAAAGQTDVEALTRENRRLKRKLEEAEAELRKRHRQIDVLETKLAGIKCKGVGIDQKQSHVEFYDDNERDEEILSHHFSEVIRRHDEVLARKDQQIRELQEALAKHRCEPEQQVWSHDFRTQSSIAKERLRRTEAAVKVFKNDLDLVKNQLSNTPLEEKYTTRCSGDEVVIRELERRRNFGVIADIEKMGQQFLQRLELEEKLDRLHWNIEKRRHQRFKDKAGDDLDPKCSYNKEFEMLEITRHNLLRALGDLRAKVNVEESASIKQVYNRDKLNDNSFEAIQNINIVPEDHRPAKSVDHHVHFKEDVQLNTIQTLYEHSYFCSEGTVSRSDHEPTKL